MKSSKWLERFYEALEIVCNFFFLTLVLSAEKEDLWLSQKIPQLHKFKTSLIEGEFIHSESFWSPLGQ